MKCMVCNQEFKDTVEFFNHLWDNGFVRTDHAHNWQQGQPCPFCGSHVTTRGIPPDGWEVTCDVCEFLFDED